MLVNFRINDGEINSNETYETTLSIGMARKLLKDAVVLLNNAYELSINALDETELSSETKEMLTEDKIIQLSNFRDDGWVTDTAIAMINYVYEDKLFELYEDILNYTYLE